ncbi:MAG TPA: hypothetical protein VKE74_35190, partial [Gemmataceae bacterium]|nr:hypothetical protein [Gemmataceae bacterium]
MPPAGPATDPTSRTEVSPTPPASPSSGTGPEQYVFITPVWGEAYVERFVKLSLPSQISAGNLGAIPAARVRYLIFTRREHIADIRRTPAFRRLRDIVPVSLLSLDDLPDPELDGNPHPLQTAAYTRGIGYADRGNTAFVFLTPDILLGDGSIENMVRLADAGRRVVLVAGVRMSTDGAVACIARHRQGSQPE